MNTQTQQSELIAEIEKVLNDLGLAYTHSDGIFDVVEPKCAEG